MAFYILFCMANAPLAHNENEYGMCDEAATAVWTMLFDIRPYCACVRVHII